MIDRAQQIQHESDRLAAVLAACDPAAAVPSCPGWTALDLLAHVVTVQRFWATAIGDRLDAEGVDAYERTREPLPTERSALLELRRAATADLLAALGGRDPAQTAWSWFEADQTVGFSWRMQTHEATVHRVDAELTAGLPVGGIAPEVAADGVDHVVDVMWAWVPPDATRRTTGTLELRATDSDRRWPLRTSRWSGTAWGQAFADHPAAERAAVADPGVPADAVVSGTAHDLDLLLWGRADEGLTRAGDPHVLDELQAVVDAGIP